MELNPTVFEGVLFKAHSVGLRMVGIFNLTGKSDTTIIFTKPTEDFEMLDAYNPYAGFHAHWKHYYMLAPKRVSEGLKGSLNIRDKDFYYGDLLVGEGVFVLDDGCIERIVGDRFDRLNTTLDIMSYVRIVSNVGYHDVSLSNHMDPCGIIDLDRREAAVAELQAMKSSSNDADEYRLILIDKLIKHISPVRSMIAAIVNDQPVPEYWGMFWGLSHRERIEKLTLDGIPVAEHPDWPKIYAFATSFDRQLVSDYDVEIYKENGQLIPIDRPLFKSKLE